jgi:hypothetical protein
VAAMEVKGLRDEFKAVKMAAAAAVEASRRRGIVRVIFDFIFRASKGKVSAAFFCLLVYRLLTTEIVSIALVDQLSDISVNLGWRRSRGESFNDVALRVNQELFEIPFDSGQSEDSRLLLLQELEDWMCVVSINFNLLHNLKADTVVPLAKGDNLLFIAWLLSSKLIARESQDHKSLLFILLIQLFQTLILRSESTFSNQTIKISHETKMAYIHWQH